MSLLGDSYSSKSTKKSNKRLSLKQVGNASKVFNLRDLWIFRISLFVLIVSIVSLFLRYMWDHIEQVPTFGGEYIEGVIGAPKYINPLYASLNDVDYDIARLVYSSLFKRNNSGEIIPDLAKEYSVSEDGKEYLIKINQATWHNGDELRVDDIVYTFNLIKDVSYQSPLRASFGGVEIEKVDDESIKFILAKKNSRFIELLDFGILPQDLWYKTDSSSVRLAELNLKPIGSGPYKFQSFAKDKSGVIKLYTLENNDEYYGKKGYIENLTFKFFVNYEELLSELGNKSIDGINYLPASAKNSLLSQESWNFHTIDLSSLTAVFFNTEKNIFLKNKKIREALALAIDRNQIISDLGGDYKVLHGPLLPSNQYYNDQVKKYEYDAAAAQDILKGFDWQLKEITEEELLVMKTTEETTQGPKQNDKALDIKNVLGAGTWLTKNENDEDVYLIVRLSVVGTDENLVAVKNIKKNWEAIGVKTIIDVIEPDKIGAVIKSRDYEGLFYGLYLRTEADLYTYWQSSKKNPNGINLSNYHGKEVELLLEKIKNDESVETRLEDYHRIQKVIVDYVPAIFLYSPTYTYIQDKKIKNFLVNQIYTPSDRFSNVEDWYIFTNKKLKF